MQVETQIKMQIKKLQKEAIVPTRATSGSAGYDLASIENTIVPPHGKALVGTGIALVIPQGCYGRIAPRSGLAWKNFIDIGAGVIDCDYTGEVKILLFNHSDQEFQVSIGQRIAQLILEKIAIVDVEEVPDLQLTQRGQGGFGSSGL